MVTESMVNIYDITMNQFVLFLMFVACATNKMIFMLYGHTRLTHSYLIEHTDPPKCTNCNQLLSIKHILTECTSYDQAWHQYYSFTDIKNILSLTPSQNILNFILKINLYDQLHEDWLIHGYIVNINHTFGHHQTISDLSPHEFRKVGH